MYLKMSRIYPVDNNNYVSSTSGTYHNTAQAATLAENYAVYQNHQKFLNKISSYETQYKPRPPEYDMQHDVYNLPYDQSVSNDDNSLSVMNLQVFGVATGIFLIGSGAIIALACPPLGATLIVIGGADVGCSVGGPKAKSLLEERRNRQVLLNEKNICFKCGTQLPATNDDVLLTPGRGLKYHTQCPRGRSLKDKFRAFFVL